MNLIESALDRVDDRLTVECEVQGDEGTLGMHLSRGNEHYVLVAKTYAYERRAAFIEWIVQKAIKTDTKLIFYQNNSKEFTVFKPSTVDVFSERSTGSDETIFNEWREIGLEYGLDLEKYLDGEQVLLPNNQSQLEAY